MSATEPNLKELERRLRDLLRCVIDQAAGDPEFAAKLEGALLGGGTALDGHRPKGEKKKRIDFRPVAFLDEHGEDGLVAELERRTDEELRSIMRSEGIAKGKALKSVDRPRMITEILGLTTRRLRQGSA